MRGTWVPILLIAASSIGCDGAAPPATTVRLAIVLDERWALTELAIDVADEVIRVAPASEVTLVLDDAAAGTATRIDVIGQRGSDAIARGETSVIPILGAEIDAVVVLALASTGCEDACAPDEARCEGDAVERCERGEDGCLAWSAAVPCESGRTCSLGECSDTCADECATGETRCDGETSVATCGQADSDTCLDWLAPSECTEGETCVGDRCRAECEGAEECTAPPATTCADIGTLRTYLAAGDCVSGRCVYAHEDTPCTCEVDRCVACTAVDWTISTIDSAPENRTRTAIAVDPSGGVHVSYADARDDLAYAHRAPGATSWDVTPIGGGASCSFSPLCSIADQTSIAIDAAGRAHVVFYGSSITTTGLHHAFDDGSAWQVEQIDHDGYRSALAIDARGVLHVVFSRYGTGALVYGQRRADGTWGTIDIDPSGAASEPPVSLAIDGTGGLHVAFHGRSGGLRYAHRPRTGGAWTLETIDADSDGSSAIAADATGGAHVAYEHLGMLRYAFRAPGGTWAHEPVDAGGRHAAIAVDRAGRVHVAHYAAATAARDLRYAHRAIDGTWSGAALDTRDDTGESPSITVDRGDGVHIAYRAWTANDVRHAFQRSCAP
ncbi:hypothetical protein [Sandaracinus amylolyticus]|uniref:hypothetical protein n=1 Tax=Sandaracinus amylolyticus TaxID=927083 RepID=UPI001F1664C3|nr:hypothetical protein [Sandaracinus amylolyticus]UJR84527.1 Hypothetical protein I5071_66060 [Sandaracinus amylolyticus]